MVSPVFRGHSSSLRQAAACIIRPMQNVIELPMKASALAALVFLLGSVVGCSGNTTLESSKNPSFANPLDENENALLAAILALRSNSNLPAVASCATLNDSSSLHAD